MIKSFFQNHKLAMFFFTIYFLVGCFIFTDYGSGWDEEAQRLSNGKANVDYIVDGNGEYLIKYGDKYHGPAWEMFLYGVEAVFNIKKISTIHATRHFLNFFLFFVSVIYLFITQLKLKIESKTALLVCALYVLMPRLFEDAFVNSKDTVFLSVLLISNFYLINWLQKRTYKTLFLFAIISGLAIAVRILGILIPIFSIVIYFLLSKEKIKDTFKIGVYLITTYAVMVLFWPVLWEGPIYHFIEAFKEMKKFPWDGMNLYFGKMVWSLDLPWHHLPLWFLISTPIFITFLFLFSFFILFIKSIKTIVKNKKIDFLTCFFGYQAALFFAPFIMIIIFKSVVYDGWRHVFFVASPFILIIALGLNQIFNASIINNKKNYLQALLLAPILYLIFWNIKNHPHQNVYFNKLITANFNVRKSFDIDYWGVSYKQGLEKLIEKESGDTIIYSATNYPGYQAMSTVKTSKTILYVDSAQKANYYLTNYRWHPDNYKYKKTDSIMVDGFEIMGIYKVR